MEAYEGFASVYDVFMGDTDYDGWVSYLEEVWKKENFKPTLIADLGCGTGNITQRLAEKGYGMIGIDISEDMLAVARKKSIEENLDILYLEQDMREFELYGTVNCVISLYDSLNYITEESDLLEVFRLVNNYLHPQGYFIFDLNTIYKFQAVLAQNSFGETTEDSAYIWQNYYDEEEQINEFYMNFFIKNKKTGEYKRTEEYHYEKAYSVDTIKRLVIESGMELVGIYDAFTFSPPNAKSERIHVVAREVMKTEVCDILQEEKERE